MPWVAGGLWSSQAQLTKAYLCVLAVQALGQYGLEAIKDALRSGHSDSSKKLRILTHCNTGSLATAEYGTALGVIRAAAEAGQLEHAYCTETRPYNQGPSHTQALPISNILLLTSFCKQTKESLSPYTYTYTHLQVFLYGGAFQAAMTVTMTDLDRQYVDNLRCASEA